MSAPWTIGQRIALGFALALLALFVVGGVAYRNVEVMTSAGHHVTQENLELNAIAALLSAMKDAETGQRGFTITGDESFLGPYTAALQEVGAVEERVRAVVAGDPAQGAIADKAFALIDGKLAELKHVIDVRRASGFEAAQAIVAGKVGKTVMDDLRVQLGLLEEMRHSGLERDSAAATAAAATATSTVVTGTVAAVLLVALAGWLIVTAMTRQIGAATRDMESSAAELQAASQQQATGAKEQATAMTEISTTISQLLATSRQIAGSAQRVAEIAEKTAASARSGDATVQRAREAVGGVQRQVDVIVTHMLDLGRKSQQIGAILHLVNELAEQTNILAINATIEAAGAGEGGRRFAVVADEIRKLADRVGGSTKEIRTLVEEVRAAVNTTVMVTEAGSKAVDAGTRQVGEAAASFAAIASLVETTTEAAQEIGLSTKQQTTAVEQVNLATVNVAQTAKETEASTGQILQTASQLTALARALTRLIKA